MMVDFASPVNPIFLTVENGKVLYVLQLHNTGLLHKNSSDLKGVERKILAYVVVQHSNLFLLVIVRHKDSK